jgi:hypothetical protein
MWSSELDRRSNALREINARRLNQEPASFPVHRERAWSPIARILGLGDNVRIQDPKLQKTTGRDPKWYIRPYYDGPNGTRERDRIYLGRCSEMPKREAIIEKRRIMDMCLPQLKPVGQSFVATDPQAVA